MARPGLSILLVEDEAAQARLLCETLKDAGNGDSFNVTCVDRLDNALITLGESVFDALLLDLSLPDSSGLKTVERVQARFSLLPIIVLTGNDDEATALAALKKGAQDYLIKGQADGKTLFRAIHYAIERKRSEDALAKVTQLLGTILDATHMLIAYMDREFNFVRVNMAYANAEGKNVRFFKGKNLFALEPDIEKETIFREVVRTGAPHYEYGKVIENLNNPEQGVLYWDWSIAPTKDGAGTVTGLVYTLVDVTKQKLVEEEIIRSREQLELTVQARTAQLRGANEQLRQEIKEREAMQEQLRASHEMNLLGRLASGVAHEVRNPLNGILAISEALFKDLGDNVEYLPYLEHIRSQVNRLSALMKDLLDLGKPLSPEEFYAQPIEGIIRSVMDSFKHSSRHKNREIEVDVQRSVPSQPVKVDSVKIQQVFFNLLENACDHSPDTSKITVEITGPEDGYCVVRVIDRGVGVPPELLSRICEPFFTTRKGGTGLGLSIVKHIVEMHGGAIAMSNNFPLPGLTVEVRLPVADVPG
jgi:signal transduction histidine kinase/DNA-binding response OmpR family regulator